MTDVFLPFFSQTERDFEMIFEGSKHVESQKKSPNQHKTKSDVRNTSRKV